MSIDPEGKLKGLRYQWQIAAVDLPVPSRFTSYSDTEEWKSYLRNKTPVQQLEKFGQAIDEFCDLLEKATGIRQLSLEEQAVYFSKWQATVVAGIVVYDRLQYVPNPSPALFDTDLDRVLFHVTDFLKGVNSSDLKVWEARRARHKAVDDDARFDLFTSFRYSMLAAGNNDSTPNAPAP